MSTAAAMARRIRAMQLDEVAEESVRATSDNLSDLQRGQMYEGLTRTGRPIEPPYAAETIRRKKRKGQPFDRVTLNDTDAFYQGINVRVGSGTFELKSTDRKSAKLQEKYGEQIFGLSTPVKTVYVNDYLAPVFRAKITDVTGLKFS